jgi:catecholate siderophore receptor
MRALPAFVVIVLPVLSVNTATASTSAVAFQAKQDTTRRDSTAQTLGAVVVTEKAIKRTGYTTTHSSFATKTDTPLRDTPQSVSIVNRQLIADQSMQNMADVVRNIPSISMGQGEGHRDAPTIRGNSSTADFFVDGIRDDAQYYRDTYNLERVEALKGSNAMIFGRGGGGGVINRVTKEAGLARVRSLWLEGGSYDHRRGSIDIGEPLTSKIAARFNGMYENSGGFRDQSSLERSGVNPTLGLALGTNTTARHGDE